MAQQVFLTPQIVIGGVDLTNRIDSVTLEISAAAIETTTFGQSAKTYVAGLYDNKFTAEFQQDFASAEVDATIAPLIGGTAAVVMFPQLLGFTSATNPAYTFTVLVDSWKPLDGKVGDLLKSSITWPITGQYTRHTT